MKNTVIISSLLILVSCGSIPRPKHEIQLDDGTIGAIKSLKQSEPKTRSDKYFNCVKELNREGIKQSLIKVLCDSSFGEL